MESLCEDNIAATLSLAHFLVLGAVDLETASSKHKVNILAK